MVDEFGHGLCPIPEAVDLGRIDGVTIPACRVRHGPEIAFLSKNAVTDYAGARVGFTTDLVGQRRKGAVFS